MSGSMALRMPELSEHHEAPSILAHEQPVAEVQQVGYQTWTQDNLCVTATTTISTTTPAAGMPCVPI